MFTGIISHQGTVKKIEPLTPSGQKSDKSKTGGAEGGLPAMRSIDGIPQRQDPLNPDTHFLSSTNKQKSDKNKTGGAEGALRFEIETEFDAFQHGESISVDGCCLTVVESNNNRFWCDVSPETLAVTTLKNFQLGQKVNLEKALRLGDRLGGHWLTGHVDHTASVALIDPQQDFCRMAFSFVEHPDSMKYLIPKGSITVNGVSLTVNTVDQKNAIIEVMLIPETLAITNLAHLKIHNAVNIELDWMSKLVVKQCQEYFASLNPSH